MINVKIRAVIYTDSKFVGASKTYAKITFIIQQAAVIAKAEKITATGPYGKNPR